MKTGDISMAMTRRGVEIIQTDCNVKNRDAQRDCLIVQWSSRVPMRDVSMHDVSMHSQVTLQVNMIESRHSEVIVIDDEDREVTAKSTVVRNSVSEHAEKYIYIHEEKKNDDEEKKNDDEVEPSR